MNVIRITDETDLESVVHKLVTGRVGVRQLARAVDAIKAANPGVDLETLRPGDLVFVPPIERAEAASAAVTANPIEELETLVASALVDLRDLAEQNQSSVADENSLVTGAVKDATVRRAATATPQVAAAIADVQATVKTQTSDARSQVQAVDEMAKGWLAQLKLLTGA
jgi:hypothetical protein